MNRQNKEEQLWAFSEIPNIEESNFNKILERFYGLGVAGLTRENIQNSLDGRLKDSTDPVVVNIQLGTVNAEDIPGMETIKERIMSLEGRSSYSKETIAHMQETLNEKEVEYISFEDSNTKGLSGAKFGQSNSKDHTWGIYAYNKGVHFEEESSEFEASRGGSHGVGKIASNAASDLHMMYFANCDGEGEQHLGGTVQLIEHKYGEQYYRSTGYFAKTDTSVKPPKYMPFENNFSPIFEKNTRGLKIIIPFLRKLFNDEVEVVKAVCDNFFISILQKKLIVQINDTIIDAENISSIVKDEKYYIQNVEDMKKEFTPLYVKTFVESEPQVIKINNGQEEYQFNLYFRLDEDIPKGRVGIVRTIGMKIEDFTVKNNSTKPFNAILIGGLKEDTYLKSLENESHTKISKDDIKDPKLQKAAGKFITQLNREIIKVIDEALREKNPVDGKIDTGDLLYTMEIDFKANLADKLGAVKIQNGKSIVTTNNKPKQTDKVKEKRDTKGEKPENNNKEGEKKERKKLKKVQKGNEERLVEGREAEYKVSPAQVSRVIVGDRERVQLNLSGSEEILSANDCHLKLVVIDGMGNEYSNELKADESFSMINDLNNAYKPCVIKDGVIQNVKFNNGVINLEFALTKSYNRSLKFIYYVEV